MEELPYGEFITKITVRYNQYCCGLQFFTNTGKFSPFFGKQIGNTADVDIKGNLLSYGGRWDLLLMLFSSSIGAKHLVYAIYILMKNMLLFLLLFCIY